MKNVVIVFGIILMAISLSNAAKPTISISDLNSTSGITKEEVVQLTSKLVNELVMANAFEVIDRTKRDEILREQGFNFSGATDQSFNLIKIGKLLGVQKMIGGSIGKLGNVFSVDLQMLDVNTSRINLVFSREYTGDVSVLLGAMKEAALAFANGMIESKNETQQIKEESKTLVKTAQLVKTETKTLTNTGQQLATSNNVMYNDDGLIYLKANEAGFNEYMNPKDSSILIEIPEGEFTMGQKVANFSKRHKVYLDKYYMGKYEITVGQYKKYCKEYKKIMPNTTRME